MRWVVRGAAGAYHTSPTLWLPSDNFPLIRGWDILARFQGRGDFTDLMGRPVLADADSRYAIAAARRATDADA